MKYLYLLIAGFLVSGVHFYLVWQQKDNRKYSVSENAIATKKGHLIYFATHIICEVFFLLFSYQFFVKEHHVYLPFYLNISFALFDFVQAALPSRGKIEVMHFASAYISWCCYLISGIVALFVLRVAEPYLIFSLLFIIPTISMFIYMHINRSKLYPYQLAMVPMFVVYILLITIGASR